MERYQEWGKNVLDLLSTRYSYLGNKMVELEVLKKNLPNSLSLASNEDEAVEILGTQLKVFNDIHLHIISGKDGPGKTKDSVQNIPIIETDSKSSEEVVRLAKILSEADSALNLYRYQFSVRKLEEAAKLARQLGQKELVEKILKQAKFFGVIAKKQNYDTDVADSYLFNTKVIGPITIGDIGAILYIRIASQTERFRKDFDVFNALKFKQDNYIIDLRQDAGGNSDFTEPLVEFLLGKGENQISYYVRRRTDENNPLLLTDFEPIVIKPRYEHETKKIVVLWGPRTVSSAEILAMDLKAIPGCVSIGDTSRGQSGSPNIFLIDGPSAGKQIEHLMSPLDYGAKCAITIPSCLYYRKDKTLLQNMGLCPDVRIRSTRTIRFGKDLALERAFKILQKKHKQAGRRGCKT